MSDTPGGVLPPLFETLGIGAHHKAFDLEKHGEIVLVYAKESKFNQTS
jgi:hypothetical protein